MTTALQTYQNNFADNMSYSHGFVGAHVEFIGESLRDGQISTHDAAVRLLALKRTIDKIFDARGEEGSARSIIDDHRELRK